MQGQPSTIVLSDFSSVDTVFLGRLYVLLYMELATRRIVWFAITEQPDGAWVTQQSRNGVWELDAGPARFLIHDHNAKYARSADRVFQAERIRVIKTPIAALRANADMERQTGSGRRECLDWMLVIRTPPPRACDEGMDRPLQRGQTSPRDRCERPGEVTRLPLPEAGRGLHRRRHGRAVGKRRDRARLEQEEPAVGRRPFDVLRTVEVDCHTAGQLRDRRRLLCADGPLGGRPARRPVAPTTHSSGLTAPETSRSPTPLTALTRTSS